MVVKILEVDAKNCRIALSIKQMQQDPLTQTLDTVRGGRGGEGGGGVAERESVCVSSPAHHVPGGPTACPVYNQQAAQLMQPTRFTPQQPPPPAKRTPTTPPTCKTQAPWGATRSIPEDIQKVVDRLETQQAITNVIILQQATESHLFAQVGVGGVAQRAHPAV